MERCDYQRIQEYLRKGRKWVKRDNDLATLYYMAGIWEKESQKGKVTVYKRTIQETVEPFYELQRRVRRLEWWDDYEKQEIFNYMMEQELSVYELQRAVETACVDKKKVWRRLSE